MLAPWVREETQTAELEDQRLNTRLSQILAALAQRPTASIPAACGGEAEMTAAYRFFRNAKADFASVLAPHQDATRQRLAEQPVVLLPADTTELDCTRPHQQMEGLGPLDSPARRGLFLHLMHAFTPEGTPLGTLWAETWTRRDEDVLKSAEQKRKERRAAPIEEKESHRWVEGLRQAQHQAEQLPGVHCVYLADSEADVYEVFVEAQEAAPRLDYLVRAGQNRALRKEPDAAENLLRERALAQPVLFTNTVTVRGRDAKIACETRARRKSRGPREATVEARAVTVTLRPPPRPDRQLPEVTVNVVLVSEPEPPEGEEPVEWLLVTTLPIDQIEDVRRAIQYYSVRFLIEILFRVLKSGCRMEQRQFQHVDHLRPCLAVYLTVAWRTLFVVRLGRSFPDLNCEAVFDPAEWKSVYMAVRQEAPPTTPPSLSEMVRLVAQLGGYVNRPRPDPPGPQTVWLGMQRMHDLALAWNTFGPGADPPPKDV